jgi:hypothetical protein
MPKSTKQSAIEMVENDEMLSAAHDYIIYFNTCDFDLDEADLPLPDHKLKSSDVNLIHRITNFLKVIDKKNNINKLHRYYVITFDEYKIKRKYLFTFKRVCSVEEL